MASFYLTPVQVIAGGEAAHEEAFIGGLVVCDFYVFRVPEQRPAGMQ